MYVFKNALRNIIRSYGRNILIGIIILIISISSCVALSIKKAASNAEAEGLKNLSVTAEISRDRQAIMKKANEDGTDTREAIDNYPSLSLEELQKYAKSSSVKDFYYTITSSINASGDLKPVGTSNDEESSESNNDDKRPSKGSNVPGGMGKQGDFTITGYSSNNAMTSFVKGTSKLSTGEMFSESTVDMKCLISNELATSNSLTVGSKITLANPNVEDETYELTVSGIYTTSEDTTGDNMRFSSSSDPSNKIYTNYATLKQISDVSTTNATTSTNEETGKISTTALRNSTSGTYVFKDVNSLEQFKKDAKTMGLSEFYSVNSSDVTSYEQSLIPIKNLNEFANMFLVVVLIVGGVILAVLNMFNIRERKYEVGVLTAIGMKKWKVALQYISELLVVTFIAVAIGTAVGSAVSVPTANNLLASQIQSQQQQSTQRANNFGEKSSLDRSSNAPSRDNMGQSGKTKVTSYINNINASIDINVVMQLVGIGILLTIISGFVGVVFILRYEPLKILANRT